MAIIIREFRDTKRDRFGAPTAVLEGVLVTDRNGVAIKTVAPAASPGTDSARLESATNFVEMTNTGATAVNYAVRPKTSVVSVPATTNHRSIAAGDTIIEAVFGGAFINFVG